MHYKLNLQSIYKNGTSFEVNVPNIPFDTSKALLDIMIGELKKGELTISIHQSYIHIQDISTFYRSNGIGVATVKRLCEYAKSCNKKYISLSAFNAKTMKYRIELGFCPDNSIAIQLLNSMKNIINANYDKQSSW